MLKKNEFLNTVLFLAILLFGFYLRIINLRTPNEIYFDETYYVEAARNYLKFVPDTNWLHPPLGKIIISLGILIFGDTPLGWRMPAVIFGSLMIIIMYLLAYKIFKSKFAANCAALLLAICPLNIAQSRIAMLDTYLTFFYFLAFYFLYLYLDFPKHHKRFLILSAVSFGASCACKWNGCFGIIAAFIILIYYIIFGSTQLAAGYITKNKKDDNPINDNFIIIFTLLTIIPILTYLASYIPFFLQKQTFSKLISYHIETIKFHYHPSFTHIYISPVWSWPVIVRPIWFYFKENLAGKFIGIISIGNPFIWWSFLIFYIHLIFEFFKTKQSNLFFIIIGYLCSYFLWFMSTKGGFIYYLQPATIFMYLTVSYVLMKWWENKNKGLVILYFAVSFMFFLTFLPIVIALPISKAYYYKIMWFRSWI